MVRHQVQESFRFVLSTGRRAIMTIHHIIRFGWKVSYEYSSLIQRQCIWGDAQVLKVLPISGPIHGEKNSHPLLLNVGKINYEQAEKGNL